MKKPLWRFLLPPPVSRLPVILLCAGCASTVDEGTPIKDIVAQKSEAAAQSVPVVKSEQIAPSTDKALENYEKLLDLPQDPVTRAETMRRLADLQLEADESAGAGFEQSEQRLRQSVALYNTVLAEMPDAPGNDRILYQLSRAHQNLGETSKAEEVLQRLAREYPQSGFADEAHFRRAEALFRLARYGEAAEEYRYVLQRPDAGRFHETAQYKYGWSLYKQADYAGALDTFLDIASRELPKTELSELEAALAGVPASKKDMVRDALRVCSLALANMGGGEAANRYFARHGEPAFAPLIYSQLGENLLERKRYTDSAKVYTAFIETHPKHALAPAFQTRAIAALEAGAFGALVLQEKERYARLFDPAAPYWTGRSADPEVLKDLRLHLEDLARHYQAKGQKTRSEGGAPRSDFIAAVQRYKRLLELYPQDPKTAELRFLMAESYFEAGETLTAAKEYNKVATEHPSYEKAPDAAYAAVLAYQRYSTEVPAAQKPAALRDSVKAGLQLAERYPQHPQAAAVLTRAAEDLYLLQSWDEAVRVAARVLRFSPPAAEALRRTAWGVTADAQFSLKRYAEAETAYNEFLKLAAADAPERKASSERLASAIYKQAEAARAEGDLRTAADAFLRVGQAVPGASIRATAEYDAAAALIALKDWTQAAAVLEAFRASYTASPLLPEVDKKLVVVYQNGNQPLRAAAVLKRIAARPTETADTRLDAAWLAVTLLDQAKDAQASAAYEAYLRDYPQPLDRAQDARQRLAEMAAARGDEARRLALLREIVAADAAAGAGRSLHSRMLAAQAALELGRVDARRATQIPLKLPLSKNLPAKKQAIERAIAALSQAADYGVADVTTAAAFELGILYQAFSKSLLDSDRPRLSALELEQYNLLLEEQAFPFEEKAIQWHESNLRRVSQGVYNEWIGKSLEALMQIAPGKYGKHERTAEVYSELR